MIDAMNNILNIDTKGKKITVVFDKKDSFGSRCIIFKIEEDDRWWYCTKNYKSPYLETMEYLKKRLRKIKTDGRCNKTDIPSYEKQIEDYDKKFDYHKMSNSWDNLWKESFNEYRRLDNERNKILGLPHYDN